MSRISSLYGQRFLHQPGTRHPLQHHFSLATASGHPHHEALGSAMSLMGSSASSSLAIDLNGYDQAIQELTDSLNEVKLTAALALQESQLVREQMQQGILSVLSELSTMWCQDFCPTDFAAISPSDTDCAGTVISGGGGGGGGGGGITVSTGSGGGAVCAGSPPSVGGVEDQRTNFRYKTQLCKNFMSGGMGRCAKGEACQYAHGRQELRRICEHPRYKTKMCSLQITLGVCPHGASCFFAHHPGELRSKEF